MPATLNFNGIYASTIVPFRPDGTIDAAALEEHLRMVVRGTGLRGLLLNGHAGENSVLDRAEQRLVIEIGRRLGPDCLIVAGVNSESGVQATTLARDAADAGADAVMVFAPSSWALGAAPDVIVRHHQMIHDATKLPMFLFQGSVNAGKTAFAPDVLRSLLRLPNVVGIKEGSWETSAYEATRRMTKALRPDVAVMASGDEHLFTCFVLGSEGSLVSLAAVIPSEIVQLDDAVRRGDLASARALHDRIYPLAKAVYGTPPGSLATARLKACLKLLGRIENAACRAPVGELPPEEYARLATALTECGLEVAAGPARQPRTLKSA
jgi:4-hydroxy-tetrahydrodipicolinate synthase